MKVLNIIRKNIENQYIKYRVPFIKSEIYLIKWFPNSKTIFHGHNGKQCDFIFLNGNMIEYISKNRRSAIKERYIQKLKLYSINDTIGIHKIKNTDNKIKWSIHRYYK